MKPIRLTATLFSMVLASMPCFADPTIKNDVQGQALAAGNPATPPRKPPARRPLTKNPCAQFGVGFVKVAGSDTCVKIGGSVRIEGGGQR
jgi:hypothetical protein